MFNLPIRETFIIPLICKRFFRKTCVFLEVKQATIRELEEWKKYGSQKDFLVEKLIEWKCPKWAIPQVLARNELLFKSLETTFFAKQEFEMIPQAKKDGPSELEFPSSSGFVGFCKEANLDVEKYFNCTVDQLNYIAQGIQFNATNYDEELKNNAIIMQNKRKLNRSPETMQMLADLQKLEPKK